MAITIMKYEPISREASALGGNTCRRLVTGEEAEVLEFLARRPIHTVFIATLIRDNGLVSAENRGCFYASRDRAGDLEGVALIGHATIVEACTDNALAALAQLARQSRDTHLIRGERKTIDNFWKHYADAEQPSRLVCRELLCEKTKPSQIVELVPDLRPARPNDLEHVVAVNSLMALEEGGSDPLQRDPEGFRHRTTRRIEQGRVWIWMRQDEAIFKADLLGDTPEMIYLEGVYVNPQYRKKGVGLRCLTQLSSILLERTQAICLTVNQDNANAVAFYAKAGFNFHSEYETIYLSQ